MPKTTHNEAAKSDTVLLTSTEYEFDWSEYPLMFRRVESPQRTVKMIKNADKVRVLSADLDCMVRVVKSDLIKIIEQCESNARIACVFDSVDLLVIGLTEPEEEDDEDDEDETAEEVEVEDY